MTAPLRIQRSRRKGWRMPPNTVSVTRPGPWGNPFRIGERPDKRLLRLRGWQLKRWDTPCADAQEAVRRFRVCIAFDEASHHAARQELRGKNLACFCRLCDRHKEGKPLGVVCDDCDPCHADVELEIANA